MAPVTIPFPTSSIPGARPQEGAGRLINVQAENRGDKTLIWRPVPGLLFYEDGGETGQRGFIDFGGTLYGAFEDTAYTVTAGGAPTELTGTLSGTGPVTWARNNKSPTADLVVVDYDEGAFTVSGGTVSSFADSDLPQPNSCAPLNGYIVFTTSSGQVWATDKNDVTVDALSFDDANVNPDGLYRGIVSGQQYYAMGPASIQVYKDQGLSPFPFQLQTVIPVGLRGPWAVAGHGTGWDLAPIFVAQDCTVRALRGYDPVIVSKPDVVRDIQAVTDVEDLKASVYVIGDHAHWVLSSSTWTWVYDASTDEWLERLSYTQIRWRGDQSVLFANKWIVGDTESGNLYQVTESVYKEADDALVKRWESGAVAQYPFRLDGKSAFFNFTVGQGNAGGADPIETDPVVSISISRDGGNTWGTPLIRKLGPQGEYAQQVRVNRLGLSTQHGLRFRCEVSDPVHVALTGGTIDDMSGRSAA